MNDRILLLPTQGDETLLLADSHKLSDDPDLGKVWQEGTAPSIYCVYLLWR